MKGADFGKKRGFYVAFSYPPDCLSISFGYPSHDIHAPKGIPYSVAVHVDGKQFAAFEGHGTPAERLISPGAKSGKKIPIRVYSKILSKNGISIPWARIEPSNGLVACEWVPTIWDKFTHFTKARKALFYDRWTQN